MKTALLYQNRPSWVHVPVALGDVAALLFLWLIAFPIPAVGVQMLGLERVNSLVNRLDAIGQQVAALDLPDC